MILAFVASLVVNLVDKAPDKGEETGDLVLLLVLAFTEFLELVEAGVLGSVIEARLRLADSWC